MNDTRLMPTARAARLVAASRLATEQSQAALRRSLKLLRWPTYPDGQSDPVNPADRTFDP